MMPRTQTCMRLKTDTLEKLKLLKKQKKLSMARFLPLIVDEYLEKQNEKN